MIRLTYILLFILVLPLFTLAQINHVPNGDFEYYTQCPSGYSQTTLCTGWTSLVIGTTPDYFNTCTSSQQVGVPLNSRGYQNPASGNGYMGGVTINTLNPGFREIVSRSIIPLNIGTRYEVSISVSRANITRFASDNISILFYDSLNSVTTSTSQSLQPHLSFQSLGPISDTLNWTRLTGYFFADSAYDNIAIGGFYHQSMVGLDTFSSQFSSYAYYYFDSIVVKATYLQFNHDKNLCTSDSFTLNYQIDHTHYNPNTKLFVQLSDENGTWTSPYNIGHDTNTLIDQTIDCFVPSGIPTSNNYRLRIISTNPQDTIEHLYETLSIGNPDTISITALYNNPICENDTLLLTYNSNSTFITPSWTGPQNFNSLLDSIYIPSATTANQGVYTLTGNLFGCVLNDTLNVSIIPNPKPISSANTPVCQYDTLSLQANSPISGVSYSWTGPNGFTSNQQNPNIVNTPINASGNYSIMTSVNGCSRMDTIQVVVNDAPDSVLLSSNTPVCMWDTLRLNADTSSGNATYNWTGPYSFSSTNQNPKIKANTILQTGWYTMTASIGNCSYTDSTYATVSTTPSPPQLSYNAPVCIGDTLNLYATSNFTNVTYGWVGPNGFTSNQQNPKLSNTGLNNAGAYYSITTLNSCSDTSVLIVFINKRPTMVNLSSNSPICTTDTLMLFTGTTVNTHHWEGPNGFTAYSLDTFIANSTLNHTGWYALTLDSNGCSIVDSTYITVNQTPATPTITYTSPICNGETLSLSALGNSSSFYYWTGANSFSASGKTATRTNLQLADSGVYTVTASQNGCTASASAHIGINPTPFVNILSVDSICDGETVTFSALPSNAGANPQYNWFVNTQQVALGQTYTTTSLNNNDVIYCEMTDNTKCNSPYTDQSNTVTMTVLPWLAPSVSITSNPTGLLQPWQYVTFTANPANAGSSPQYQWKRNGQDIVGATGSTWSANNLNDNDSISVELVSDYKCPQPATAMSNGIVVSVAVGLNDVNTLNNVSLIPNPNNGQFVLKGNVAKNGTADITIINTLGQIVHSSETNITDQIINERINLNDVASGLYLLRLDINGQRANIKFRVE